MRLYIIVLALTLSACQTTSPPPTPLPSGTPVITATPRQPTPTTEASPTAVPETAEQMHLRLAETVVAHGWSPNNEATWVTPEGMTVADKVYLTRMISINDNPNTKTKEQLVSYDAFLTLMRKEQLSRDLYSADSTIAGNTNNALDKFLASGFLTAVPTPEQVVFLKVNQADFRAWLDTLTPDQISSLEMLWCIENKTAFMPSHEEQKTWIRDYSVNLANNNIVWANEWKDGNPLYGWYGMSLDPREINLDYPITVYGEQVVWKGHLGNGTHMGDFGAILRLPYERNGILVLIKGRDGTLVKVPFVTPLAGDEPNTPYYVYPIEKIKSNPAPVVWARVSNGRDSNVVMTMEYLKDNLQWPPPMIWFMGPDVHWTDNSGSGIVSIFPIVFDQATGIPVLGHTDQDAVNSRIGIQISRPVNPWP
jgi:hypothetical protein